MLRHILLIVTYFTQWFINNFIHDDAIDSEVWQGIVIIKAQWSEPCFLDKRYTLTFPLQVPDSENRDVEIIGAEI